MIERRDSNGNILFELTEKEKIEEENSKILNLLIYILNDNQKNILKNVLGSQVIDNRIDYVKNLFNLK